MVAYILLFLKEGAPISKLKISYQNTKVKSKMGVESFTFCHSFVLKILINFSMQKNGL